MSIAADALIFFEFGSAEEYGIAFNIDPEDWGRDFSILRDLVESLRKFLTEEQFSDLLYKAQEGFTDE